MASATRLMTAKEIAAKAKVDAAKEKLRQAQKDGKALVAKLQKRDEQNLLKIARKAGVFNVDNTDEELAALFADHVAKKKQAAIHAVPPVAASQS